MGGRVAGRMRALRQSDADEWFDVMFSPERDADLAARRTDSQVADYYRSLAQAENELFGIEIDSLKKYAVLAPTRIHPRAVNQPDFAAQLQALNPYFFLTLGGPLYRQPVLDAVRGVAINQHAGHSPLLKGSNTTEWALYHRNLAWVSSTVHITTTGADAGPILRRSQPCLLPDDTPAKVFLRVVALGTELMIESVQEIIASKQVTVFPQPPNTGMTYLSKDFPEMVGPLLRDFQNNWLSAELARQRDF